MSVESRVTEIYEKLPKGQKKVAEYLLRNHVEFSISTASQIAKRIDVSEATVIRFSYSLDYKSFSHMQKSFQAEFLADTNPENLQGSPLQLDDPNKDLINKIVTREMEILQQMQGMDRNDFWQTADLLMNTKHVKIVGNLASYAAAYWFYLKLSMMRENVTLLSNELNASFDNLLLKEPEETVFILISMPSYVVSTLNIGKHAKEQGAKILTITDRKLSPTGRIADICLTTDIGIHSEAMISISSVMSLINLITSGIESKYEEEISLRVRSINKYYTDTNFVIE